MAVEFLKQRSRLESDGRRSSDPLSEDDQGAVAHIAEVLADVASDVSAAGWALVDLFMVLQITDLVNLPFKREGDRSRYPGASPMVNWSTTLRGLRRRSPIWTIGKENVSEGASLRNIAVFWPELG
jgi:hypothetical protein